MITITKVSSTTNAVTHGGIFHADEVMATVILGKVFEDLKVLRTFSVPNILNPDVIVYDIGGGQYDHHQKGGNGARENGVLYSSCGLIWRDFGHKLVADTVNPELVWSLVDHDLIQGIDAIDNGIKLKTNPCIPQCMTLSRAISGFNPRWDSNEDADEAFLKAVAFAEVVFDNVLADATSKAKAKAIVDEAIARSNGKIMILDRFVPWQDCIFSSKNPKAPEIQFVVFPSNRGGYNWQCVPVSLGSFFQRKAVPSEWKGLNGSSLQEVTGIATATFCHPAGFIGGAETLEDTIRLAEIASSK